MQSLRGQIDRCAEQGVSICIVGESGVGKDHIARHLHERRPDDGISVATLHCDAVSAQERCIVLPTVPDLVDCPHALGRGTLYLKNVDKSPEWLQQELVRYLSTVATIGQIPLLVAGVSQPFAELAEGAFRQDLRNLLDDFTIHAPPLRDRVEDIGEIVDAIIAYLRSTGAQIHITDRACEALSWHSWPGNVTQLLRFFERHAAASDAPIDTRDVFVECTGERVRLHEPDTRIVLPDEGLNLRSFLRQVERDLIEQALDADGRVVAHAAKRLHVKRSTLVEKINRLGIG